MGGDLYEAAKSAVMARNSHFPHNHSYRTTGKQSVGPFEVYTVEFNGKNGEEYRNFAVARDGKIEAAYVFLDEVIKHVETGLAWRTLFVSQFTVLIGSIVVLLGVGAIPVLMLNKIEVPSELWILVASGLAYLFGNTQGARLAMAGSQPRA